MPNITGTFRVVARGNSTNGAFSTMNNWDAHLKNGDYADDWGTYYNFDAYKSNAIYGNSETVQPNAIKLLPILRY